MRFGMNKSGKNFASGSIKGSKQFPTGNRPPPTALNESRAGEGGKETRTAKEEKRVWHPVSARKRKR